MIETCDIIKKRSREPHKTEYKMESYSRGRRGAPAKGVGVEMRARVQIPHSPPKERLDMFQSFFMLRKWNFCRLEKFNKF